MENKTVADLIFFDTHAPEYSESLTAEDRCVRGRPLQRTWHHFTSEDERFFAGIWEAEPGCWTIRYTENEFCQILSGHSVLRDSTASGRSWKRPARFTLFTSLEVPSQRPVQDRR
jgi:uncharacterized cupin superfamily protein